MAAIALANLLGAVLCVVANYEPSRQDCAALPDFAASAACSSNNRDRIIVRAGVIVRDGLVVGAGLADKAGLVGKAGLGSRAAGLGHGRCVVGEFSVTVRDEVPQPVVLVVELRRRRMVLAAPFGVSSFDVLLEAGHVELQSRVFNSIVVVVVQPDAGCLVTFFVPDNV